MQLEWDACHLAGSSPLARGLPTARGVSQPDAGIIPARAGFTPSVWSRPISTPDHPRSRGVYSFCLAPTAEAMGSSPLARGLRRKGTALLSQFRIIPARAGFTLYRVLVFKTGQDHPRSRGVYDAGNPLQTPLPGSSPLARGLLGSIVGGTTSGGIIPARAGFTSPRRGHRPRREDHPRSRGVYESLPALVSFGSGSSPLARGLRVSRRMRMGRAGIIPARAGFTLTDTARLSDVWDHPRSRGVYDGHSLLVNFGHGIIPARAGFTGFRSSFFTVLWDHPRSRGVYAPPLAGTPTAHGSSPLARGLREQDRAPDAEAGIIPARAGFTSQSGARADWTPDHPRSRGVYGRIDAARHRLPGSSPLARGLPHRLTHV